MSSSWFEDYLNEHASRLLSDLPDASLNLDGEFSSGPEITVQKMSAVIPVSNELAMDLGVIPDTRPPRKPPTRRERFRWWRSGLRERIATSLYERVSGEKLPTWDDD